MSSTRLWKTLSSLWLEFWLPLPLLGIIFWVSGNSTIDYIFSRPYTTANTLKLLADPPTRVNLTLTRLSVTVRIDKVKKLTEVEIQSIAPAQTIKFKFPSTSVEQIEAKIAQELGLSFQEVRKLTRYIIISSSASQVNNTKTQ
ncbi:MAG: hypothetical protein MUD14_10290 [Hydrococcus sp. Prado102]|jgi:hypothetical protein|nr:hypothetical protein [Hydrococcus sp. Prado102]